ncbi:hypothetical protein [Streptomyces flaveolus]|uniref:hypothetical protein n=1 Tax=Streptomyces flaveolus TaxID=67297 RepID=UPI003F541B19
MAHPGQGRAGDGDAESRADLAGRGAEAGAEARLVRAEGQDDAPFPRRGTAGLDAGVIDSVASEAQAETVHQGRALGVVRAGNPLPDGELTPGRFAGAAGHLIVSRRGGQRGPTDDALAGLGPDAGWWAASAPTRPRRSCCARPT